jgi:hypothetical protein
MGYGQAVWAMGDQHDCGIVYVRVWGTGMGYGGRHGLWGTGIGRHLLWMTSVGRRDRHWLWGPALAMETGIDHGRVALAMGDWLWLWGTDFGWLARLVLCSMVYVDRYG